MLAVKPPDGRPPVGMSRDNIKNIDVYSESSIIDSIRNNTCNIIDSIRNNTCNIINTIITGDHSK